MRASAERERAEAGPGDVVGFRLYRGRGLKSRDGIPKPAMPPPGTDMKAEARTARLRAYPVTIVYTAYALIMIALGLRAEALTAALSVAGGVAFWTLLGSRPRIARGSMGAVPRGPKSSSCDPVTPRTCGSWWS